MQSNVDSSSNNECDLGLGFLCADYGSAYKLIMQINTARSTNIRIPGEMCKEKSFIADWKSEEKSLTDFLFIEQKYT